MIAILSVVACSLSNLRDLSRRDNAKTRPATMLFCEEYVFVLSTWHHGVPKPDRTIYDFCLTLAHGLVSTRTENTTAIPEGWYSENDGLNSKPWSAVQELKKTSINVP